MAKLLIESILLGVVAAQTYTNATVSLSADGKWSVTIGTASSTGVAWGYYRDWEDDTVTGFGQLSVLTNAAYNDSIQLYAAGFLEGALTQARIAQQYFNVHSWLLTNFGSGGIPAEYQTFFETQDAWARSNVATNTSQHWQAVGIVLAHLDGLQAGYAAVAPAGAALDAWAFWQLQAVGDFLDLIPALGANAETMAKFNWKDMTPEQFAQRVEETTHCSALIKVNADLTELFMAHVAWFEYSTTIRIHKHYKFALSPAYIGREMSFASYPGYLSSLDDFWTVWSSGLGVMETTNNVFDQNLYKKIVPQSLWAWQRVRVANLLANSGPEWSASITEYNSGTYNNQYQITDFKLFTPGAALKPNTLFVVEQIPGLVVGGDVTQLLELGHFPSYNVPFWPEIYNTSGYPEMVRHFERKFNGKVGTSPMLDPIAGISYQLAPRAQIFRRDAGKVNDTQSFLDIMRYNDFHNDPLSKGNPGNAICSRNDLASRPRAGGCYDGKATQASWWTERRAVVVNGPTTSHGLPPFAWTQFPTLQTEGLPAVYNYTWGPVLPTGF